MGLLLFAPIRCGYGAASLLLWHACCAGATLLTARHGQQTVAGATGCCHFHPTVRSVVWSSSGYFTIGYHRLACRYGAAWLSLLHACCASATLSTTKYMARPACCCTLAVRGLHPTLSTSRREQDAVWGLVVMLYGMTMAQQQTAAALVQQHRQQHMAEAAVLAQLLLKDNTQCQEIDTVIHASRHDLLCDIIFRRTLRRAQLGYYTVGVMGIPCSTFSVARIGSNGIEAPGPVRDRNNPTGLNHRTPLQQTELDNANQLVERSIEIAHAIIKNGGSVLFENPVDRGNKTATDTNTKDRYELRYKSHSPLWNHPSMIKAKQDLNLKEVSFPQCALGGEFQKWTTLWYSEDLADSLDDLHICACHKGHKHKVARGKGTNKDWISAEAAAYPPGMNKAIARAIKVDLEVKPPLM